MGNTTKPALYYDDAMRKNQDDTDNIPAILIMAEDTLKRALHTQKPYVVHAFACLLNRGATIIKTIEKYHIF